MKLGSSSRQEALAFEDVKTAILFYLSEKR
jgi:hypothetical protein